ncbi:MAG TPA: M23 family peptidase, partial [Phenylobacterium sp.]|nr:M23 family peptidase [Phenylobacterium sp.]
MQDFRLPQACLRHGPRVLATAGVALALAGGWKTAELFLGAAPPANDVAMTVAPAPPKPAVAEPQTVPVSVLPGETLAEAVERAGVSADEARRAVEALAQGMDTVNIKAGLAFEAAIAKPDGEGGRARLVSLSLKPSPAKALTISRTFDGALSLKQLEEKIRDDTVAADGRIEGSLYESAQ